MKKTISLILFSIFYFTQANAQFGYAKKADIEKFKDNKLIVVLFNDSTYNASIQKAVQRFWNFTGSFEFVHDSMMKQYAKGDYSYLIFTKSKRSNKLKAKLCSSEDDFNGLVVTKKYKKRVNVTEIIASAACSNVIDTLDWYPELVRSIQILNNYFSYAIQAKGEKEIVNTFMMANYPTDLSIIGNKRLIIETGLLQMKGKENPEQLVGLTVDEVEKEDIYKAVLTQDPDIIYMYHIMSEKYCDKIFVSAANSEVLFFLSSPASDPCKCTAKDLKTIKSKIDKANK